MAGHPSFVCSLHASPVCLLPSDSCRMHHTHTHTHLCFEKVNFVVFRALYSARGLQARTLCTRRQVVAHCFSSAAAALQLSMSSCRYSSCPAAKWRHFSAPHTRTSVGKEHTPLKYACMYVIFANTLIMDGRVGRDGSSTFRRFSAGLKARTTTVNTLRHVFVLWHF